MDANERAVWHGQWIALSNLNEQVGEQYGWRSKQERAAYKLVKEHFDKLGLKDRIIIGFDGFKQALAEAREERRRVGRHRLNDDRKVQH